MFNFFEVVLWKGSFWSYKSSIAVVVVVAIVVIVPHSAFYRVRIAWAASSGLERLGAGKRESIELSSPYSYTPLQVELLSLAGNARPSLRHNQTKNVNSYKIRDLHARQLCIPPGGQQKFDVYVVNDKNI
jgi:hypothetical protein